MFTIGCGKQFCIDNVKVGRDPWVYKTSFAVNHHVNQGGGHPKRLSDKGFNKILK